MKKKIIALFMAFLIVFSLIACNSNGNIEQTDSNPHTSSVGTQQEQIKSPEQTESTGLPESTEAPGQTETTAPNMSTPYFWKVTGNGYDGEFYLLGSIHVGDKNTNIYPKEITEAFEKCEHLAVESDIVAVETDFSAQLAMTKAVMYMDGTTITDHIDHKLYEDARVVLEENGLYSSTFDMLKPIYWMMLIDNAYILKTDYSDQYGVDRYFLNTAKDESKTILEIEDPVETYEALGSLNPKTQEFVLKQVVEPDYFDESVKGIKELYSVWKKGDITGLDELFEDSNDDMSSEEMAMYLEYNSMMLYDRNEGMVEAAVSYIESGKDVFYIVGLAHMIGEKNIIDGLRDKGYTVTQVQYGLG